MSAKRKMKELSETQPPEAADASGGVAVATAQPPPPGKPRIEQKSVRHQFTNEELLGIGKELADALTRSRLLDDEFDQVKTSYKARQTEAEGTVQRLSSQIGAGFELRQVRCRVVYRTKERKKDYFPEDAPEGTPPVLTEDMTGDDFQQDLLQAESAFERREEIRLWPDAPDGRGLLVVGRLAGRWFSALRINVAGRRLEERLDGEQKSYRHRNEAVKVAALRMAEWMESTLGKYVADGFREPVLKALEPHKEREE